MRYILLLVLLLSPVFLSSADGLSEEELLSRLTQLHRQAKALQTEASILRSTSEAQKNKIDTLRVSLQNSEQRISELAESLEKSRGTIARLSKEVESLNQDLATLQDQLRDLSRTSRREKIRTGIIVGVITALVAGGAGLITGLIVN